jgi:pyruvate-ferredoxin/flavodoxin oxidoreductase
MQNCLAEQKKAVEAGYWHTFRYNPETGKVTLDSKAPTGNYQDFIRSEVRYARLAQSFPERADVLFAKAEDFAKAKYEKLKKLSEQ